MKDEHDKSTADLSMPDQAGGGVTRSGGLPPACKPQPKRGNVFARRREDAPSSKAPIPDCATSTSSERSLWKSYFVPVSFAANDWKVTPRRIRSLLAEGRLTGHRLDNGYWEVAYPYQYFIGTRGPALKRTQLPKRGRPKLEGKSE
jgi:hypothetical protein